MIRVFCDWCSLEAKGDSIGGGFGRRIAMTENGKLNVCVTFEFPLDDRPEHLCIPCFCKKAIEAVRKLETEMTQRVLREKQGEIDALQ